MRVWLVWLFLRRFFVLFFVFFRRVVSLFLGIFLGFVVVLLFWLILFSSVACFSALYSFSFNSSVSALGKVTYSWGFSLLICRLF